MAEKQNVLRALILTRGLASPGLGRLWPKACLQHITKPARRGGAVQFHAAAQSPGVLGGQRNAGIHGGFVFRGRLDAHQLLDEVKQRGLLAPGSGQQGAHRDGRIGGYGHL